MDFLSISYSQWLLALSLFFVLSTAAVLVASHRQREILWRRIGFPQRRTSISKTPPRSPSPDRPSEKGASAPAFPASYADAFPPSRRCCLADLVGKAADSGKTIALGPEPSDEDLMNSVLPMTQSYLEQTESPKYTPTGFSTDEIKAMGDFPAYDILSGVPLPKPYENFNLETALPRPYRPFRWAYHQTMSLTKLEPDWYLEVENTYRERVALRRDLYTTYGKQVLDYLPGSELACKELMEISLQFYCARYPTLFRLTHSSTGSTFHNDILSETTDLSSTPPLHVLLQHIPEDFAIVQRNEADGMYYFRAGVICSSLGWSVATKLGKNLQQIHSPVVPDYAAKMARSMDRFFSKLPTAAPIQRGSWGLEVGEPLFMPPGDPHAALRETQDPALRVDDCSLRVDWQTLRRLPLSGAVVFNFTGLFTKVTELRDERFVPALLAKVLREGKKNLMEYKATWHVEHVCLPALDQWAKEQVAKGWVPEDWEVGTLDESPFYPGWEEAWHTKQGF